MKMRFTIILLSAFALLCVEMSAPKSEWPELVGKTGEEAKAQILKDRTDVTVKIQDEHGPATADYNLNRVRIFVDKDGKVAGTPRTG